MREDVFFITSRSLSALVLKPPSDAPRWSNLSGVLSGPLRCSPLTALRIAFGICTEARCQRLRFFDHFFCRAGLRFGLASIKQ